MSSSNISDVEEDDDDLNSIIDSKSSIDDTFEQLKDNLQLLNDNDGDGSGTSSTNHQQKDNIDHELNVIFKLRVLLNECELLSNKINNLKLKTDINSSIYNIQNQVLDSIKQNEISKQKLNEKKKGIESSSSILYKNKF